MRQRDVAVVTLLLIVGVGGAITTDYRLVGLSLAILGASLGVWQYLANAARSLHQDALNDAIGTLFAKQGVGNPYIEAMNAGLRKNGVVRNVRKYCCDALRIEPNNIQALEMLVVCDALGLSFEAALPGSRIRPDAIVRLRECAERGRALAPSSHLFLDALGVLHDVVGNHRKARACFLESAELRDDPYWRLLLSTTLGMSGAHEESLEQVIQARREGGAGWLLDLYEARALCSLGRYHRALARTRNAMRARGAIPEICVWSRISNYGLGRFPGVVLSQLMLAQSLLLVKPIAGIRSLAYGASLAFFLGLCAWIRLIWVAVRNFPDLADLQLRICRPDQPYLSLVADLASKKHYLAASSICRRLVSQYPELLEHRVNLATCVALAGNRSMALQVLDEALLHWPNIQVLLWNRRQVASGQCLNPRWVE